MTTTTDTDLAALHRAVLLHPAEDTPRLMYADRLEETGQPDHAQAIRLWCTQFADRTHKYPEGVPATVAVRHFTTADGPKGRFLVPGRVSTVRIAEGVPGVQLEMSRGFISGTYLSLAAFVGGPCGRCVPENQIRDAQGRTLVYDSAGPSSAWHICPDCRGTGRTPGLAADLFRAHPIEAVRLTDRRPARNALDWEWLLREDAPGYAALPAALFDRLTGWVNQVTANARYYPEQVNAADALSRACVAYGRKLVGLPPLPA